MRSVHFIKDDSDIYQPVMEEDLKLVENELDFIIPVELKNIYRNPNLEQIKTFPTLLWPIHHNSLGIIETNKELQTSVYNPFPSFLVAFATNECSDFWVINSQDQSIIYIDPDKTIEENLKYQELRFDNFQKWLLYKS